MLNFFIFFTPQGTKFPQGNTVSRQLIHNKEHIHREKDTKPKFNNTERSKILYLYKQAYLFPIVLDDREA